MLKHGSLLLGVHGNHKAHQDGKARTATSTFTQLLNSGISEQLISPDNFGALRDPRSIYNSSGDWSDVLSSDATDSRADN